MEITNHPDVTHAIRQHTSTARYNWVLYEISTPALDVCVAVITFCILIARAFVVG